MVSKCIIICCDGEWSQPRRSSASLAHPLSSVAKLAQAITTVDPASGRQQQVYYLAGAPVRSGRGWVGGLQRWVATLTGRGVATDVCEGYRYLVEHYSPGDEVYLFGFGRGGYVARVLADMLAKVGLLQPQDQGYVPQVHDFYRTQTGRHASFPDTTPLPGLVMERPQVKFLGVWDTVGGLGLPRLSRIRWPLHPLQSHPRVEHAYQALAIDERRRSYRPDLWTQLDGQVSCQQVWFPGSHTNLGGGGVDTGLADLALIWMVNRARAVGLHFDAAYLHDRQRVRPNSLGRIDEPLRPPARLLRRLGVTSGRRPIGKAATCEETLHESVIERVLNDPRYRPDNLFPNLRDIYPLAITAHNHRVLKVADKSLPIFRERQSERQPLVDCRGTLQDSGGALQECEILDHSIHGGARLRATQPLRPGSLALLNSLRLGATHVRVVWAEAGYLGVCYTS